MNERLPLAYGYDVPALVSARWSWQPGGWRCLRPGRRYGLLVLQTCRAEAVRDRPLADRHCHDRGADGLSHPRDAQCGHRSWSVVCFLCWLPGADVEKKRKLRLDSYAKPLLMDAFQCPRQNFSLTGGFAPSRLSYRCRQ